MIISFILNLFVYTQIFKLKVEKRRLKDLVETNSEIIIYNTDDGNADVKLYSKDGVIWMNQQQMGELY